ncbi:aminoglycoside phosphotransferase family protein [Mycobacterium sp. 1274761.0]|uniref:aminoglycoside phosphotransferase family protein n=1 Tax=Mycobacterium sp. 1274761.0 TaxID=1834077 RepID=UPI0009ED2955|nr:aminoglycoside phosphotransferase family protein [Mycobacterium sp. 1274761.0]
MSIVEDLLGEWDLRTDGDTMRSPQAVAVPVRTSDATPAVLKVGHDGHEHLVLRRWNGDGAARLLRADPHRRALLLERLGSQSLHALFDVDACETVAALYGRLHVPAMPQLPSLSSLLAQWADEFAALPRSAAVPHRLVEQAMTLCRDLAAEPAARVLHGDLHYDHVLVADREPWLAVSPKPVNGDPHYEVAPMLWHRWDDVADDVRFGVQRRFYAVVDAAGFDEDRARGYAIVRVVRGATRDPDNLTKYVALAKAVQD